MPYKDQAKRNEAQRLYRKRHPEYAEKERQRLDMWKAINVKPAQKRYCVCGAEISLRKKVGLCKSCEKAGKTVPRVCMQCGGVFVDDNRARYCLNCREKRPTVLDAIKSFLHRKRAKAKGLVANFSPADWRRVKKDFGNRCAYCGREGDLTQDHFVPHAKGGGYTKKNIVPACKTCNSRKSDNDPRTWLSAKKYWQIASYLEGK